MYVDTNWSEAVIDRYIDRYLYLRALMCKYLKNALSMLILFKYKFVWRFFFSFNLIYDEQMFINKFFLNKYCKKTKSTNYNMKMFLKLKKRKNSSKKIHKNRQTSTPTLNNFSQNYVDIKLMLFFAHFVALISIDGQSYKNIYTHRYKNSYKQFVSKTIVMIF